MINFARNSFVFIGIVFLTLGLYGQDCTLDIGGDNTDRMIQIFQLNTEQTETMENLRSELEVQLKAYKKDVQKLFDEHPQSTTEELQVLAGKYRILEKKIMEVSRETDKKLLATFNTNQYQRYLDLCHEAFRKPIRIIPVRVKDTTRSR